MTRELKIEYNDRIGDHFSFLDYKGNKIPNSKLFGKTTTFPFHYHGFTRERDGHTYWLISPTNIHNRDVRPYDYYRVWDNQTGPLEAQIDSRLHPDIPLMNKYVTALGSRYNENALNDACMKAIDERVWIPSEFLTNDEIKATGLGWEKQKASGYLTNESGVVAVRDDSLAWDVFLGTARSPRMPIPYQSTSVKAWDDKIRAYLKKQGNKKTSPTQPDKIHIKKLTNYTPVKVMNKINEIIEYLEGI